MITSKQNLPKVLDLLAAQREAYIDAKNIFKIQAVIAAPIACAFIIIGSLFPALKTYIALYSLTYFFIDLLILTPYQSRIRKCAAKIQEQFDCEVLDIHWNDIKCGSPQKIEDIVKYSGKYCDRDPEYSEIINWYPHSIDKLPSQAATLLCQRTNCWWDADQRRKYAFSLLASDIIVALALMAIAICQKPRIDEFLISYLAPSFPLIFTLAKNSFDQFTAAKRLDELHSHGEMLWLKLLSNKSLNIDREIRSLQNEIFDSRSKNQPTLEIIYKLLKDKREIDMNKNAEYLAKEFMEHA